MNRKSDGILVFENVEALGFCGPFEVFSATRVDEGKRCEEPSPFSVFRVCETPGTGRAGGRMKVDADFSPDDCPARDLLPSLRPRTVVERRLHYVEDGGLFASADISAAIDFRCRGESIGGRRRAT